MLDDPSIGKRVRMLRGQTGLSQAGLAAASGVSTSYVSLIEAGRRVPRDSVLRRISRALQVSPSELLGGSPADPSIIDLELRQAETALDAEHPGKLVQRLNVLSRRYAGALSWELDCRLQIIRAEAQRRARDPEGAIAALENLLAGEAVPDSLLVQAIRTLCAACLEVGDVARCIELGERELRRLRQLDLAFSEEYVALGVLLTSAYLERGDVVRAEVLARQVVKQSELDGSGRARGMAYHSASLAADARGDSERARALAGRALAVFTELDARRQLSAIQLEYALTLLLCDPPDPDEAAAVLAAAEAVIRAIGTDAELARWQLLRAKVQLAQGDAAAALADATQVAGPLGNPGGALVVEALLVIAECHIVRHDAEEADVALSRAADSLAHIRATRSNARLWRDLGDLYLRCGAAAEAAMAYRQALAMAGMPARTTLGRS